MAPKHSRQRQGLSDIGCCIRPRPTINSGWRGGLRGRRYGSIVAIVADFESYPQWNDEVRAVCVLARCGDGHYPSRTEAEVHESAHKT
jgi:hypothetical protein